MRPLTPNVWVSEQDPILMRCGTVMEHADFLPEQEVFGSSTLHIVGNTTALASQLRSLPLSTGMEWLAVFDVVIANGVLS